MQLEPRQRKILDKLLRGDLPALAGNHTTMSRLMTALLKEIDLPWQTCVALCYAAMSEPADVQAEDLGIIDAYKPTRPDPLAEFLAAKDRELEQLEVVVKNLQSRKPKAKKVAA